MPATSISFPLGAEKRSKPLGRNIPPEEKAERPISGYGMNCAARALCKLYPSTEMPEN